MGTVVEKLQYLAGTKEQIKKAIKSKGIAVADADTFRSYAEKIESIGGGGGSSVAEYVFMNTTEEVSFPREALTESANNYFYSTASYQLEAMKAYLDNGNEVAYWGSYEDSWKVLQNSESWSGTPMTNTNIAFAFSEPVMPNFFHNRIGSKEWDLRATNDWDIFTTYLGNGASPEFMTALIENGSNTNITGGVDTAVGDGLTAYKYYVFKYMYNYSDIYNLSLKAQTGNVSCVLKSGNMSPSFKAFPSNYMRVVTQPWYNGEKVIDGKEMTMKPYADGGCLIGYTDTGAAVNLKMFYLKSDGTFVDKVYDNFTVIGNLNVDTKTGIVSGFDNSSRIKLPESVKTDNWSFAIKANYKTATNHQGIFFDGTLDRTFGEIHNSTQTMSSYITGSWTDGTVVLENGADYWFLFVNDGSTLKSYVKKDAGYASCPSVDGMELNFTISDLSSFTGHDLGVGCIYSNENWVSYADMSTAVLTDGGAEVWNAATMVAAEDTYVLSPDDSFEKPSGYGNAVQVADLDIPAHSVPVVIPPVTPDVEPGVGTE